MAADLIPFEFAQLYLYTHLFAIRLHPHCSDKEAWAQLQKDGRNVCANISVSTTNSFHKDVVNSKKNWSQQTAL